MPERPAAAPKVKIIYKKRRAGHGHHGGAWKVAFADFMTAMMALFLVLWIMSQSQEVKQAVAYYFRHATDYEGKADAILRGNMGLLAHKSGRLDARPNIIDSAGGKGGGKISLGSPGQTPESVAGGGARMAAEPGLRPEDAERPEEQEADEVRTFLDLADQIWGEIGMDPAFFRIKDQVLIETHEEGLLVQLLDCPAHPLFEEHSERFKPPVRKVLAILAQHLKSRPNKLEIDGHGTGLARDVSSKWLGSAHLADLVRRKLEVLGLRPNQITKISGCADTRPLNPKEASDGLNQRISILVHPRQWRPQRY